MDSAAASALAPPASASAAALLLGSADPFLLSALAFCVLAFFLYPALFWLSSRVSPRLSPAYAALSPSDKADWNTRLPSTVHAVAIVAWALALAVGGAFSAAPRLGGPTAPLPAGYGYYGAGEGAAAAAALTAEQQQQEQLQQQQQQHLDQQQQELWPALRACAGSFSALGLSVGYFSADVLAISIYPAIGNLAIWVHHAIALMSLFAAFTARAAHAPVLAVLASELTTPLVNVRFWLDRSSSPSSSCGGGGGGSSGGGAGRQKRGFWYAANGLALAAAWFVSREAAFAAYGALMWRAWPGVRAVVKPPYARAMLACVPALLFVLNTVWFVKIVRGARKLVGPFKEGMARGWARRVGGGSGGGIDGGGGGGGLSRALRRAGSGGGGGGGPGVAQRRWTGAPPSASATVTTVPAAQKAAVGMGALRQHVRVDVVAAA